MPTIEDAIQLAVEAHRGQQDKSGAPYVLHALRVMLRMPDEASMMAAVLHDVVEDSPYTLDDLQRAGYPEAVVEAVDHLTRRPGEPYETFVRRAIAHPVARRVKQADLEDNMNLLRLRTITEQDRERLQRYRDAWELLQAEG